MSSASFPYPVAISRLGRNDSPERQMARGILWLAEQSQGAIVVVTPTKQLHSEALRAIVNARGISQLTWRGLTAGQLRQRRVAMAWPDRRRLNMLWDAEPSALVVVEDGGDEANEWIEDARPIQLFPDHVQEESPAPEHIVEPLPNDADAFIQHIARMAAGYSSGLKWNEEDKLKADMMNRPERWATISVSHLRARCRQLGMRPDDVDTIAGYLQRRKEGRRFNVSSSYRTYRFN
ncbi:hypothetical protein DOE76_02395 [Leifsonia sp. ku-ls]|nr:hypothetical protein DOE76_02395 [Leifsonia sp. ku-ls]